MNIFAATGRRALPYTWYFGPVFILTILGITTFSYLTYSHYQNYTNIAYSSFCALSRSINCDTVSQSDWSVMFGLPVAVWGLFGYLIFFFLLLVGNKVSDSNRSFWSMLLILALIFSFTSIVFGYISATKIKAYCILCITGYATSFALLFYCWIIRNRFCSNSLCTDLRLSITMIVGSPRIYSSIAFLTAIIVFLQMVIPHYWDLRIPPLTSEISSGLTDDGSPWIGAEHPELIIEEYSDYQCFQCNKMHYVLRLLVQEYPEQLRLVHRHYPLDHGFNPVAAPQPFHVGSGKMALIAIYAANQGKFWEMNDLLFDIGRSGKPFNTRTLSENSGIPSGGLTLAVKHPAIRNQLLYDIRSGLELNIMETPTFVIDGKTYTGVIPDEILEQLMD